MDAHPIFGGDPVAATLSSREALNPPQSWGLVITGLWPVSGGAGTAGSELTSQYTALRASLEAASDAWYIYPLPHLHCTLATLSSFRDGSLAKDAASGTCLGDGQADQDDDSLEPRRAEVAAIWQAALDRAFAALPPQGKLTMAAPVLKNVGIFLHDDPDGVVAVIRDAVRIAAADPALEAAGVSIEAPDFAIPSIVHSSFLRFVRDVSDEDEAARLRDAFESASAAWQPVEWSLDQVRLVVETVPYMHMPDAESATAWAWSLDP